jgi:hypothetical protein
MILAFLFDDYDWPLTPVAAILDFANKTVPGGVDLGAHKKSKKYGMNSIWAKFWSFWKNLNQTVHLIPLQPWLSRKAQIEPPLFECECEWAFRIQA